MQNQPVESKPDTTMFNNIKNLLSYVRFVFSLNNGQLLCCIIDILVLAITVIKWNDVVAQPTVILIVLGVFTNFIWQVFNVSSHFRFLKMENPDRPLKSLLEDKEVFDKIKIDESITDKNYTEYPYVLNRELHVLDNPKINSLLRSSQEIYPCVVRKKSKTTTSYVKEYKETLLKFLNHKWHDVNHFGGKFTNDAKLCLASEIYCEDGKPKWAMCKGEFYKGQLTNFIFCQYVGGTHFVLYPPMNIMNGSIKSLGKSVFSDHVGVSTLMCTSDGNVVVFRQSSKSSYGAGKMTSSGSGSLDYKDYRRGDDLKKIIIRGAERELKEESSIVKAIKELGASLETSVVSYYRDLERGGKPEFCCISKIDKPKEALVNYISPNPEELEDENIVWIKVEDNKKWDRILQEGSLSLKMNYRALMDYKAGECAIHN